MTTIAYNHKDGEIAVDSRLCRGQTIITDETDKAVLTEHGLFVLSGYAVDVEKFIGDYPNVFDNQYKLSGFLVKDKEVFWVFSESDATGIIKIDFNEASGSGQDHAMTAMDLGYSAKQAVEMAIKRDCHSGGKVKVFKVSDY